MDVNVVDDAKFCFPGILLSFLLFSKKGFISTNGCTSAGLTKSKAAYFVKSRKTDCLCTKFGSFGVAFVSGVVCS